MICPFISTQNRKVNCEDIKDCALAVNDDNYRICGIVGKLYEDSYDNIHILINSVPESQLEKEQ